MQRATNRSSRLIARAKRRLGSCVLFLLFGLPGSFLAPAFDPMSTPRRKKKTAPKQNKQTVNPAQPDALPHCPNSEGAEFRRREIHRVLAEEFDHPNKEHRPGWSAKRLAELGWLLGTHGQTQPSSTCGRR
jgi:hypothetical protein